MLIGNILVSIGIIAFSIVNLLFFYQSPAIVRFVVIATFSVSSYVCQRVTCTWDAGLPTGFLEGVGRRLSFISKERVEEILSLKYCSRGNIIEAVTPLIVDI